LETRLTYGNKVVVEDWQKRVILEALEDGQWRSVAEKLVGLPTDTITYWCHKGSQKGAREPFKTFALDIEKAEAKAEAKAVAALRQIGMEKDWKALLEWLKRRAKDRWGDEPLQLQIDHNHSIVDALLGDEEIAERVGEIFRQKRTKPNESD